MIVDLPSSGRNVWNLAATTPGVMAAAGTLARSGNCAARCAFL